MRTLPLPNGAADKGQRKIRSVALAHCPAERNLAIAQEGIAMIHETEALQTRRRAVTIAGKNHALRVRWRLPNLAWRRSRPRQTGLIPGATLSVLQPRALQLPHLRLTQCRCAAAGMKEDAMT